MISDDAQENDRIAARNAKIKELLAENDVANAEPKAETKAEQGVAPAQPRQGARRVHPRTLRPLEDWERVNSKGQVETFRRPSAAEVEAQQEREFLKGQWEQDQVFAAAVKSAEREQEREVADNKKRREHEDKTGKREYGKERFISLEEARRRGYLQSTDEASSGNNWSSPNNPDGLFCGGR